MKYGMPRLIDDRKRMAAFIFGAVALLAALALVAGYESWYGSRRAELRALVKEADGILERLDGSSGEVAAEALEQAKTTLEAIAACAGGDVPMVDRLELDAELYVEADRERARQLSRENDEAAKECTQGWDALQAIAGQARTAAEAAGALSVNGSGEAETAVLNELKAYRDELDALACRMFPSAKALEIAKDHFSGAQSKVADVFARTTSGNRREAAKRVLDAAKTFADRADDAKRQIQEAQERAVAIRAETVKLKIDRQNGRFAELRRRLQTAAQDAKDATEACAKAEERARKDRADLLDKAQRECREALGVLQDLMEAHGSLLPAEPTNAAVATAKELKEQISLSNETWEKLVKQTAELVLEAGKLCEEATSVNRDFDATSEMETIAVDIERATILTEELLRVRRELTEATEALDRQGRGRELEQAVGRLQASMDLVRAKVPDVELMVDEIRRSAKTVKQELDRAQAEKTMLSEELRSGRGVAKETLTRALEGCAFPEDAAGDLMHMEGEKAANGRECLALQSRLDSAQKTVGDFAAHVRKIHQTLEDARGNGQFAAKSWEAGAIGWATSHPEAATVSNGDELVADRAVAASQYEWEFDLNFERAGEHRIEVRVCKPESPPVNESIDRRMRGSHDGQFVNGGWIGANCQLKSPTGEWCDELWFANHHKLEPSETIVAGRGKFGEGYQTFRLNLHLDSSPAAVGHQGWHPERLVFTVYVDGVQVRQFWHKAR